MTFQSNTGESKLENLEDLYELSPMQQGMLFHSIYSPDSGAYFEQSLFTIKGKLNLVAFAHAWQRVMDRHPILRTSFLWEDLEKPLQAVYRQIDLSLDTHDWRNLSAEERDDRLQSFIAADRRRGFLLSDAPLIRLALFRFSENECRFLFSRHHLLLDRWSRALLLKDFFAIYDALASGSEPHLDLPRPFGDYISWLSAQDVVAAEKFWRTNLRDFSEPTSLGLERNAVRAIAGEQYADLRIQLSETATAELLNFAREHRLTLNTLVQGAWALLLSRYSGEDDVVFGVTVAGRPATLAGAESMVGLFINTLPLRVHVSPQMPLLSWLKELQEQQGELQQYEYSSLLDIQGWSDVPRGVPLFESILVFENLPVGSSYQATNNSVEVSSDRGIGSTTGYPLTVLVNPAQRLSVQVVYDRARYHAESIRRLLSHLQTLLENLPADPEALVSRVSLLSPAERKQILIDWNDTDVSAAPESIRKRFEAQVQRTPHAAAVIFDGQTLSYRELNSRANQLAHYLRRLGVGADVKVGVCFDRSLEMVIGVLATVKAGGSYVPLDPEYPRERLQFMLNDAQCSVLLANERVLNALPKAKMPVLCLDRDWNKVERESDDNPQNENDGETLLYVIYTSGSTGQPKGVAMNERALANLLSWQLKYAGGFKAARTLQFASLSFDVSFQEIFSTWCSGGTLLLISNETRRDALSLLRLLVEQKVQRIFLPFVYLQHLAEAVIEGATLPADLNEIITAGEQLEITPQIAKLFERLKNCTLHNHYGPSESHVVTAYSLSGPIREWPSLPPIGRPIWNTQIYILDNNLEPAPIGVPGQLCIAGASLARGYLDSPQRTAEKFFPNPFGMEPGTRMYLTGDLARYQEDGNIEFLGRIDNQVKIRGIRIELGEIEALLAAHLSVRKVAVVAREDVKGDRKLVAYLVTATTSNGSKDLPRELRAYLKEQLPDHMIPATFVTMETLPLTPSGKINRRALAALEQPDQASTQTFEPPREPMEEKLAEIWAAVLKRERVGIRDNFFELGGHSLLATQLISRVRNTFKVELPLRSLFESPTVAELAPVIVQFELQMKNGVARTITRDKNSEAEELLGKLDQLSDEDVDSLLQQALAETGDSE
jgi:amino acid adenylation domain-containing protein